MKFLALILLSLMVAASPARALFFDKGDEKKETPKKEASAAETRKTGVYVSPRFRNLDQNKDGKISQEEYLADTLAQFKSRDADKDSALNADEVDFPPNTPENLKNSMRKQMQVQEEMMETMRAETQKRIEEERKKMAEQQKQRAEERKAATPAPVSAPVSAPGKPKADTPKTPAAPVKPVADAPKALAPSSARKTDAAPAKAN